MFLYFVYFVIATQSELITTFVDNPHDSWQKKTFMYEIGKHISLLRVLRSKMKQDLNTWIVLWLWLWHKRNNFILGPSGLYVELKMLVCAFLIKWHMQFDFVFFNLLKEAQASTHSLALKEYGLRSSASGYMPVVAHTPESPPGCGWTSEDSRHRHSPSAWGVPGTGEWESTSQPRAGHSARLSKLGR